MEHVIEQPAPWYWRAENVRRLMEFLFKTDRLGEGLSDEERSNILYYLEKPWKWNEEWAEFLQANPNWKA